MLVGFMLITNVSSIVHWFMVQGGGGFGKGEFAWMDRMGSVGFRIFGVVHEGSHGCAHTRRGEQGHLGELWHNKSCLDEVERAFQED